AGRTARAVSHGATPGGDTGQRRGELVDARDDRASTKLARRREHHCEHEGAADAVDAGRVMRDGYRRARRERGGKGRRRVDLRSVDTRPRTELADRGREAAREPAAAGRSDDRVDAVEILEDLEPSRAVRGPDRVVADRSYAT